MKAQRLVARWTIVALLLALVNGCAGQPQQAAATPVVQEQTLNRAVESLAQQIVSGLPQDKTTLVAVLDFNDLANNVSAFGRLIGEELVTKLVQTRRVNVVERSQLDKAVNELKFSLSEIVDPAHAKQLGRQVGADAVVTGTVTDLGTTVKINARLIEVEKGDILAAAGAEVAKDGVVARLMSQILTGPTKGQIEPPKVVEEVSASPPVSKPTLAQAALKIEAYDFLFLLQECKKSGPQITCSLLITNLIKDRELQVHATGGCVPGASRLFDSTGNVYVASRATLGNNDGTCWGAELSMVSKIPTRATLLFEGTEGAMNGITVLEVVFGHGHKDPFWGTALNKKAGAVQFRNVPLSQ